MIKKIDTPKTNGTSFWGGIILCTKNELVENFGNPQWSTKDIGEKVQNSWDLETTQGIIFTIYDWKEYREYQDDETIEWHVGNFTKDDTLRTLLEIYKETGLDVEI